MEETMKQRRRRQEFTEAYKAEVVMLCQKGDRSIADVALDLSETSVRRWVAQAEVDAGCKPGMTSGRRWLGCAGRIGCCAKSATFSSEQFLSSRGTLDHRVQVHRGGERGGAQRQPGLRGPRSVPSRLVRVEQAGAARWAREDLELSEKVKAVFTSSGQTYGSRPCTT